MICPATTLSNKVAEFRYLQVEFVDRNCLTVQSTQCALGLLKHLRVGVLGCSSIRWKFSYAANSLK